jgi:hypothetical protein
VVEAAAGQPRSGRDRADADDQRVARDAIAVSGQFGDRSESNHSATELETRIVTLASYESEPERALVQLDGVLEIVDEELDAKSHLGCPKSRSR